MAVTFVKKDAMINAQSFLCAPTKTRLFFFRIEIEILVKEEEEEEEEEEKGRRRRGINCRLDILAVIGEVREKKIFRALMRRRMEIGSSFDVW